MSTYSTSDTGFLLSWQMDVDATKIAVSNEPPTLLIGKDSRTSRHDLLVGYNPPLSDRTPEKKLGGKNQVVQSLGINGKKYGKKKTTGEGATTQEAP